MKIQIGKANHKVKFITPSLFFLSHKGVSSYKNQNIHSLELAWLKWGVVIHFIMKK